MFKSLNKFDHPQVYWLIIIIAVLIGSIARLKGLGTWNLALDEYYIIKSSENIIKYGLPHFPDGGYYSRGLLLQYLISLLISIGIKAEFAGRIFSVLANLFTIIPLYLIVKRIGNIKIATVVIVLFSFSIWEIEFARFARMYAPFQAICMWYIYLIYEDIKNKSFKNFKWYILLSTISFLVYEGSIFLAVFNFVPFVLNKKIEIVKFVITIGVFFASAFFNLFNFRLYDSPPIFPSIYLENIIKSSSKLPIKIPKVLFPFAFNDFLSSLLTIILLLINIILAYKLIKLIKEKNFWSVFSIIILGILAYTNQFGLFLFSLVLFVFWNFVELDFRNKKIISFLVLIFGINLVYWFTFGLISTDWYLLFDDFSSYSIWGISKRLFVGFFNFPDTYNNIVEYLRALPLLTSIFGLFIIFIIVKLLFNNNKILPIKFFIGSLIFLGLLATIPSTLYKETRYTFFLAPLFLIISIYAIDTFSNIMFRKNSILRVTLFLLIVSCTFIFSKDFNLYHMLFIDQENVNYRMIYENNNYRKHLYRRWDIKSPTDYVKNNMKVDDIIIINENSLEYYLPKVDYFNFDYRHHAFSTITIKEGSMERWSRANLIYTNEDLVNILENSERTIWFLIYPEFWFHDINFYERYKNNLVYTGIDGMIKVFKFSKKNTIELNYE